MSKQKDTTSVTLAHGTMIDGKYRAPGETVTLSHRDADGLTAAGYVVVDDPAVTEAGPDAASGS